MLSAMNTATATSTTTPRPPALRLVAPAGRRSLTADRTTAVRQVRDARRRLEGRDGRFAHLRRSYD